MSGHGGKRLGAGRKDTRQRIRVNFTLSAAVIARLRQRDNMSDTVEAALVRYLGIDNEIDPRQKESMGEPKYNNRNIR